MAAAALGGLVSGAASVAGSKNTENASNSATGASERATALTIAESSRQFDLTRADTAVARQSGEQANIALGYMLGIRKPPTASSITSLNNKLKKLKDDLKKFDRGNAASDKAAEPEESEWTDFFRPDQIHKGKDPIGSQIHPGQDPLKYWFGGGSGGGGDQSQRAIERSRLQGQITQIESQLKTTKWEYSMADQLSAGAGTVPDISTLMDGVDMPDIDKFLTGVGKDLENSEFYQFELKQGRQELQNMMSKNGTAYGGNAMKAALEYGTNYAASKGLEIYDVKKQEATDKYRMNLDEYNLASQAEQQKIGNLLTMSGQGAQGAQLSSAAGQSYASQVGAATSRTATIAGEGAYAAAAGRTQAMNDVANSYNTLDSYNRSGAGA